MKAFIFDFDGVIVDSELHWDTDAYDVYKSMIPSFTRDDDKDLKGRNIDDIYSMLVENFGFQMSKNEYKAIIDGYATKLYQERAKLLPGTRELINRLQQRNIPIAIASSGERKWVDMILQREGIAHVFAHIVMAADVGIGKPDPTIYREAAKLLGCQPNECIAYEDSTNGIRSAKGAGMTCVAIKHPWGYVQDLSEADVIVTAHDELTEQVLASL